MSDLYGPIFTAPEAEASILSLVDDWLPAYIAEVERQVGLEARTLALPRFYGTSVEADPHPGEKFPAVIVVSPGTVGDPVNEGGGAWAAWYQITVASLVMASDEIGARRLAGYYAGAIRALILQHGSLGGVADGVRWDGEEFQGEPGGQRNRSRGASLSHFRIKIPSTVDASRGGSTPPDDPYDPPEDFSNVQTIAIDVQSDE